MDNIKTCPDGKILNPTTNRCVKKDGPTAKKLYKSKSVEKTCGEGKILNPKTGRCIKADGATAAKLKGEKVPSQPYKSTVIKDEYNSLTTAEKALKKSLPSFINERYIFNIDFIINEMKSSGNSTATIKSHIKKTLMDLADIKSELQSDMISNNNPKQKDKYKPIMEYNDNRIQKIQEYYNSL